MHGRTTASPAFRADNIFFPAVALLIFGIVFAGFAQSYFLAGLLAAPLPNGLVHIHGALFVCWIVLLVIQTSLVAAGRPRWHMRLGLVGAILLPLMLLFGVLTLFDSIRRGGGGPPPEILLVGDSGALILFAVLIGWALRARRDAVAHKRLMILGTLAIIGPAVDRIPDPLGLPGTLGIGLCLPLLIVGYDLWSRGRIHRTTAIGYGLIATLIVTLLPISTLPIWHLCVAWIRQT